MSQTPSPIITQWLAGKTSAPAQRLIDRLARSDDIVRLAIMPDVHAAAEVCVGTVMATTHLIYPTAVGGDIGCGMAAVAFDACADFLSSEAAASQLYQALYRHVPTNRHAQPRTLPQPLIAAPLSDPLLEKLKQRDAAVQLGTLGRGNHFLEFQRDDEQRLWLMVHSSSRALGQAVRDFHLRNARRTAVGLSAIDTETDAGRAYLSDAAWAAAYATANRRAMVNAVSELMHALFAIEMLWPTCLDCDHNHVRRETHFGQSLWVHRKGATPAHSGEPGIIPGSMGTRSFHAEGRGHPESLCSSSHGAGRAMSREEARWQIRPRDLHRQLHELWYDQRATQHLVEEAPAAYKDIAVVMRAQRDLTRIVRTLRPLLSYKGV